MDKNGFCDYLIKHKASEEQIKHSVAIVEQFDRFLREREQINALDSSSAADLNRFSLKLIDEGCNSYESYKALARYSLFSQNLDLYSAVVELMDGAKVLDTLYDKLGQAVSEEKRDEVFKGIERPPLGTSSSTKPKITQAVVDRLEATIDQEQCRKILSDVAHGIPRKYYHKEREKFLQTQNIDDYLKKKRDTVISELKKHMNEGTLFYNQEITESVFEFVSSRPDVLSGERRGKVIYHTKIPYRAKKYLEETNEQLKRYHYCHCSWVREGIKTGNVDISPTFCYCSAGFTKQPWEAALDQRLEVKMIKSVLKGDLECSFIVSLPNDVIEKAENAHA